MSKASKKIRNRTFEYQNNRILHKEWQKYTTNSRYKESTFCCSTYFNVRSSWFGSWVKPRSVLVHLAVHFNGVIRCYPLPTCPYPIQLNRLAAHQFYPLLPLLQECQSNPTIAIHTAYELTLNLLLSSTAGCMSVAGLEILHIDSSGREIDIALHHFVDVRGCYRRSVPNCLGRHLFHDCLLRNRNSPQLLHKLLG